jgi:hypothetical protein
MSFTGPCQGEFRQVFPRLRTAQTARKARAEWFMPLPKHELKRCENMNVPSDKIEIPEGCGRGRSKSRAMLCSTSTRSVAHGPILSPPMSSTKLSRMITFLPGNHNAQWNLDTATPYGLFLSTKRTHNEVCPSGKPAWRSAPPWPSRESRHHGLSSGSACRMMRLPALVVNDDTKRRYFALAAAVKKVPVGGCHGQRIRASLRGGRRDR